MTSALRQFLRPALLGVLGVLVALLVTVLGGTTTATATAVPLSGTPAYAPAAAA